MSSNPPTTEKKNADLIPRIVVAVLGIPFLLSAAFLGPNWIVWACIVTAGTIGAWEYMRMMLQRDFRLDGWVGVASVAAALSALYWANTPLVVGATIFLITASIFATVLIAMRDINDSARRLASIISGFVYVSVLFGGYVLLIKETPRTVTAEFQAGWFLFPMFVVWAGDTGAYFVGRAIGKRKLAPRVSPGKSWEGAIGGLVFSVIGAFVASLILPLPAIPAWLIIVMAVPGAILGQMGDLCESLIKRATGFKDSSSILYGHGGMLDRIDALMFACPWIYIAREFWLPM